jgi:hypothetical protein
MSYRILNADHIEATIARLLARMEERFPDRGLTRLCGELLTIAREDSERLSWQARPNILLRSGVALALVLAVGATGALVWWLSRRLSLSTEAFSVVQGVDAAINVIVLASAAIWFMLNLEARLRRRAVLEDLHELRSIAHVVDMHQLTKDPTTLLADYRETPSSHPHGMTEFELTRYLDYCSEMLACTGKLAALYMQNAQDPVIIQTVNEIEDLTGNLSRKIWQKIMILRQGDATPSTPP